MAWTIPVADEETLALLADARPDRPPTDQTMPQRPEREPIRSLHGHPDLAMVAIPMGALTPVPISPTATFLPAPFDSGHLLTTVEALLPTR